jgi:PIN domain nuclease of toxin-antitoxin system
MPPYRVCNTVKPAWIETTGGRRGCISALHVDVPRRVHRGSERRTGQPHPANAVFLSIASVWEAVIKSQLGQLLLPEAAEVYLPTQRERHRITSLTIDEGSLVHLGALPPLHRDPFDRMLISQALQRIS